MQTRIARIAFVVFLAVYGFAYQRTPDAGRLLDGVDLAIHETGHIVFAPFGTTMGFLGGTLFQLIVPAAFVVSFWRRADRYAAAVALWWVAQNCWHIAVYVADARAEELELVGGGEHDWAYLLGRWGWLARDQAIARGVHGVGVLIFLVAIGGAAWVAWRASPGESGAGSGA